MIKSGECRFRMANKMTFGQFARTRRRAANLSQAQVAEALGLVTRASVSKKELGRMEWSLADVMGLARALEVSASELLAEWEKSQ